GVGAADAEGADPGAPWPARALPVGELGVDVERAGGEVDPRVGCREMQAGRDLAMLQREHGLDQARHPRGGVEMADVGLDRADGAEAPARRARAAGAAGAERLAERRDLDRVP